MRELLLDVASAAELDGFGSLTAADVVFDLDDAQIERFVVHHVTDDEAEVAFWAIDFHFEAAFGCVLEMVGVFEGHGGCQWLVGVSSR